MSSRIESARWRPFRLPMRRRFDAASGAIEDCEGVLLELRDSDGATGMGEASPLASIGGGTQADVMRLLDQYGSGLPGQSGVAAMDLLPATGPGVAALRCAVDTALLDLEGRTGGQPVAALLDETPGESVLVNAVIGEGSADEVVAFAAEALEAGYSVLKLKAGTGTLEHDASLVGAVRDACPDAVLRLDANGAWDEETAAQALTLFTSHGVELLEQPVAAEDVEALARLRELSPFRLAADEALSSGDRVARVIELRAADLLVLKPMVLGGVRPALALARRAALAGIGSFVTTTFDSSIGTAAALHLAAALPWDAAHGLGTGDHLAGDVVAEPLRPVDGGMAPSGPGLGVEVDDAALEALATGPWVQA